MPELVTEQIILTIVGMACTGVIGYLSSTLMSLRKRERARDVIDKCVARNEIRMAYERYVINEEKLTDAHYNELDELFDAYLSRGWNGTGKQLIEGIRAVRPYIVID